MPGFLFTLAQRPVIVKGYNNFECWMLNEREDGFGAFAGMTGRKQEWQRERKDFSLRSK
jgi:hypothetical protein